MSNFKQTLKNFGLAAKARAFEAPEQVVVAGAAVIAATAKLIDASSSVSSKRAYARKMNHSIRK